MKTDTSAVPTYPLYSLELTPFCMLMQYNMENTLGLPFLNRSKASFTHYQRLSLQCLAYLMILLYLHL